jgi:hypothetical protein
LPPQEETDQRGLANIKEPNFVLEIGSGSDVGECRICN